MLAEWFVKSARVRKKVNKKKFIVLSAHQTFVLKEKCPEMIQTAKGTLRDQWRPVDMSVRLTGQPLRLPIVANGALGAPPFPLNPHRLLPSFHLFIHTKLFNL